MKRKICYKLDQCMPFLLRRILGVFFGVTEMIFFGGIMYGFNALYPLLKKEKIFADLCEDKTSPLGCETQVSMYANAFTTYSVLQMVMLVVVGILVDTVGLRIVKIGSTCCYFIGMLMFSFMSAEISWIIFPAGCFTCVGGMGMMICNFSISQLFTKTSVLVLAFITGSYDASSTMFAIVNMIYDSGVSFQLIFLVLGCVGLVMGIFSGCFILTYRMSAMGDFVKSSAGMEDGYELSSYSSSITKLQIELLDAKQKSFSSENDKTMQEIPPNGDDLSNILRDLHPSRKSSLKSLPFILLTLFFCLALLRFTFFLAQLTPQVAFHFNNEEISNQLGQILSFALAGGILAGLICGAVIDKLREVFKPKIQLLLQMERSSEVEKAIMWFMLRPMSIAQIIMTTFALVVSSLVFIADERVYYANYFFLVIMRGFLFSTFSSSMLAVFPTEQFGTVYGIGGSIAGAFSCLQYALLLPSPNIGNGIALGLAICMYIPPLIILINSFKSAKTVENYE